MYQPDKTDLIIIEKLEENSKLTLSALSFFCGLSIGQVQKRIKKLEDKGVIQGYHADIAKAWKVQKQIYACYIQLSGAANEEKLIAKLHKTPELKQLCENILVKDGTARKQLLLICAFSSEEAMREWLHNHIQKQNGLNILSVFLLKN